jgi:hypothetical protein
LIQQANRPEIRTVQGKVNHQIIEDGSAFLPDAKESDPQLNSVDHKKAVNMLSHPSRIWSSSSLTKADIQSLPKNRSGQMPAQALCRHQINPPGQKHFQVIHEFQVGVKVFAASLKAHQQIHITVRPYRLITRKRAEHGAA